MAKRKNGQIHQRIETELLDKLTKEAKELGIPRAELVRIKLFIMIILSFLYCF